MCILQIIFAEADTKNQRYLGHTELEMLISAAYTEYCGDGLGE